MNNGSVAVVVCIISDDSIYIDSEYSSDLKRYYAKALAVFARGWDSQSHCYT